ncbi:hypothetical protein, partial [Streptococcus suis]|uniref:hypothetical protein n=1 Tax=Streptococcus suis TaxID=1307 RepID=UPI001C67ABA5
YTLSPHLHFMITKSIQNQWVTIPCRFRSEDHIGYLKPLYVYTSVNKIINRDEKINSDHLIAN